MSAPRSPLDWRRLFEAAPGLSLVLNPDLTIVAVTDAYLRATMTQRDEILGRGLFDVFPDNPDDPTATGVGNLGASLQRVLRSLAPDSMAVQKYDIRRPASEGGGFEERYWSPVNTPVLDEDGQLIYIIHRVEDVTELVRLRQAEDARGQVDETLPSHTSQLETEVFLRAQEVQAANRRLEAAHTELARAHDELEARVLQRTAELEDANRALRREVAERQVVQHQLEEANQQLNRALAEVNQAQELMRRQERLRALGELASGIAHDFNNALGMIVGFAELLLVDPNAWDEPEEARSKVRLIHSAAMGAGAVVSRLRELYRPDSSSADLQPVQVNDEIARAISLTQPRWRDQAQASGRTIRVETDLQTVPTIDGRASELREALANLIINAVDAMPTGGTLTLRSRLDGEQVVIEVADTGIGMSEAVRARLFEAFFTTKGEEGTGLGLVMVRGIVERHSGEIEVSTLEGHGTTFTIRLPKGVSTANGSPPPATPIVPRRLRVLLAEDEPSLRRILVSYLQIDHHQTVATADGREALEAFEREGADLVITDRAMPELNGDQLAAAVKRLTPDTPVIMLTGLADLMSEIEEKPDGVDLVIPKPVTLASFRAAIASIVGGR